MLGGALAGLLVASLMSRRVVLRTDRALVVLGFNRFAFRVKPSKVVARLPKDTLFGPLEGTYARMKLGTETLWIHKKWHATAVPYETKS
jgi:hypothetical protein